MYPLPSRKRYIGLGRTRGIMGSTGVLVNEAETISDSTASGAAFSRAAFSGAAGSSPPGVFAESAFTFFRFFVFDDFGPFLDFISLGPSLSGIAANIRQSQVNQEAAIGNWSIWCLRTFGS